MEEKSFLSGFVSVIGRPNAGKSTLINALTGEKIAITSAKPHTTRKSQLAILTEEGYQIIFVDTPGIHSPKNKLGEFMVKTANDAMTSTDIIMFLYDATEKYVSNENKDIVSRVAGEKKAKKFLIITKVDLVEKEKILGIIKSLNELCEFDTVIPVSAVKRDGTKIIIEEILKYLPEGPLYYPDDISTVSTVREISEEIVREKVLFYTSYEVPHGVGVEIIKYDEPAREGLATTIEATIFCEKESHKKILIGKEGQMLKKIGTSARRDIEKLIDGRVNLKLWVKVKEDWRNSQSMLKELGYKEDKQKDE